MIRLRRTQTAGKDHICDECELPIFAGEKYDRIAQFESWEEVGFDREPSFSDISDPYVAQQMWKKVMRSKEVLILKTHVESECLPKP